MSTFLQNPQAFPCQRMCLLIPFLAAALGGKKSEPLSPSRYSHQPHHHLSLPPSKKLNRHKCVFISFLPIYSRFSVIDMTLGKKFVSSMFRR